MHIDARDLDNSTIIKGDICIVGAGVAGISIALQFINTSFKVILLEGGGFEYDDKVQKLYDGQITGQKYYPMMSSRLHYFGGTSGHWGGLCSPLDDIDFSKRDWIPDSGWPISKIDLDSFYKKATQILDLPSDDFNIDYWKKKNPKVVPLPLNEDIIKNKIYQRSTPTRFGEKYDELIKYSKNVFLYTYANATNLICNDDLTKIDNIEIKNYTGKKHTVKARLNIIACSAIQNARLLLASNKQLQYGVGNQNDLVGRYFMEHLEINSANLILKTPNPLNFYTWNKNISAELMASTKSQQSRGMLHATMSLLPLEIESKMKPSMETWAFKDPRKSSKNSKNISTLAYKQSRFRRMFLSNNYSSYGVYTRLEQCPNPNSRILLNKDVDSLGVPKINLNWNFTNLEKKSIRETNILLGQQIGAIGIGRLKLKDFLLDVNDNTMPENTSGGWHHIGTTRMSNDPKKGVVDSNCKVTGIMNLYIAGSSCFPTAGAVTPTLSIVALSLRLSEHIKKVLE